MGATGLAQRLGARVVVGLALGVGKQGIVARLGKELEWLARLLGDWLWRQVRVSWFLLVCAEWRACCRSQVCWSWTSDP